MANYDVDVLIVGAGPTGLMLANELAAFGVSFRIIDKAAVRSTKSRAIIVQSRGLELLDRHGLANELVSRGTVVKGIDMYVYGKKAVVIDLDDLDIKDTAFSSILLASQADTEDLLEKHLLKSIDKTHRGIERPARIDSAVADADGVDVVLMHGASSESGESGESGGSGTATGNGDGVNLRRETVRCKYIVGCDGAHSSVRHAAGIEFTGGAYLQSFMLCDTHIANWPEREPGRTQMFWDKGYLTLLPFAESKGIVRLLACKPVPLAAAAEERTHLEAPTIEAFSQFFAETAHFEEAHAPRLDDPVWVASFRLYHRCAFKYINGRMLLAGDAAHLHSPAGGQGMNTGLGDAVNLGWKIAAAVRARPDSGPDSRICIGTSSTDSAGTAVESGLSANAAEILLSSYDAERRPVGERLLRTTDYLFTLATTARPLFAWLRNMVIRYVAPLLLRLRSRRLQIISAMNQLRVRYRRSPIVGSAPKWKGVVRGGDRAPDGRVAPMLRGGPSLEETWLLSSIWIGGRGCRGIVSYHLLLFTGAGQKPPGPEAVAATVEAIKTAALNASADIQTGLKDTVAHIIAGTTDLSKAFEEEAKTVNVFVDTDGYLHGRYGFGEKPGYALMRPDGHIEHVGLLASFAELPKWLEKRGEEVDLGKPWWRW